jgi:hypothetical protein
MTIEFKSCPVADRHDAKLRAVLPPSVENRSSTAL